MTSHVIERITWRDAHDIGSGEWLDLAAQTYDCIVTSAGIVVAETDLYVVLTHSLTKDNMARGVFAIPKSGIIERVLGSTGHPDTLDNMATLDIVD